MLSAIIVAGGSSRRMGADKTFALLAGKAVIEHTIAAFEQTGSVDEIIVVGRAERLPEVEQLIAQCGFTKVRHVVPGGTHRQDSVQEGLKHIWADASFVAIHDAARPLVTPAQNERVFAAAQQHGAAALAAPVSDTLKRATADHLVCGSVDRSGVYAMQTPQIFSRAILVAAFDRITTDGISVTDEVSAVERIGRAVVLVPADDHNFKITYPADLALAELVLAMRSRVS
jgi:2-C-methyl-D-erythritol 4-phosphate cytidylyltransferase